MATDTAPKQTDTKPAEAPKAATPANSTTPAKSAASTQTKATAKAKSKSKSKSRAKTAAKSRTRSTAASSRSRTASKSRTRKPAARTTRTEATTASATAPRSQAKALNGGQQFIAGVIDAQEKTVTAIVDYQTSAAQLSQIPGAAAVVETQAKVLRSVTDTYVSTVRALLN